MGVCYGCGGLYGHSDGCPVARSYRERRAAFEEGRKAGLEEAREKEMERLRKENDALRSKLKDEE